MDDADFELWKEAFFGALEGTAAEDQDADIVVCRADAIATAAMKKIEARRRGEGS